MVLLREIVAVLDRHYPPARAEAWDAIGTVVGDPEAPVGTVLLAVDPVQAVAEEAVAVGAQLLLVHHPLYLSGVTSVAATTPKGRVVHTLASQGIALHTCHTNADGAPRGVSQAMAETLGLTRIAPLAVEPADPVDKWVVFVPHDALDALRQALWAAGAGRIGAYDSASFSAPGTGTFRPLEGANPAIGRVGDLESVEEARLEVVAPRSARTAIRAALLATHPYEEPAYDLIETVAPPGDHGHGRIGVLAQPMRLRDFAAHVARSLPAHAGATRVAGDLDRTIRTVAVCGGSGDFMLAAADGAGADVYVTSDLKHHPVSEHTERPGACAVVDVPHWAAEATWLPRARDLLAEAFDDLDLRLSEVVTDPWALTLADESVR